MVAQVQAALGDMSKEQAGQVVLAYEPIWAIGTGRTASPEDAEQMHAAIRGQVKAAHGDAIAEGMRILYGGSVKPGNAAELMVQANVDGALVTSLPSMRTHSSPSWRPRAEHPGVVEDGYLPHHHAISSCACS